MIFAFNPILVWFYLFYRQQIVTVFIKLSIPFWSDFILIPAKNCVLWWDDFQSHFGLILSRCKEDAVKLAIEPFNPILVWFYPLFPFINKPDIHGFQSHFGLILSNSNFSYWTIWIRSFQSHFGLILSPYSVFYQIVSLLSFNPILVWFYRVSIWLKVSYAKKPFNPILVWFYQLSRENMV